MTVDAANIMVDITSNWSFLPVYPTKRVCSAFEGCLEPFLVCIFTRINLCLPISEFEVEVWKYLKFALYQPNSGSYAYIKIF